MIDLQWVDIPDFDGRYQVSNMGDVRSLVSNKLLKLQKHNHGYSSIALTLRDGSGKKKMFLVHRLVALAFIPNPHDCETVNHKSGNKKNNNVSNLEWATYSDNHFHAYRFLGRVPHLATLRDTSRPCACYLNGIEVGRYRSATEAGRAMGLQFRSISRAAIGDRKTYAGYKWVYL